MVSQLTDRLQELLELLFATKNDDKIAFLQIHFPSQLMNTNLISTVSRPSPDCS